MFYTRFVQGNIQRRLKQRLPKVERGIQVLRSYGFSREEMLAVVERVYSKGK